ncbi:Flagellar hook-length control protein FliK [Xenorhabdus nematophila F1]|uniref:flagellar hook-length control protein FliK n=1 Tax=Xenorhabdus nematophila TaxID=628 RepID=UPI00032757B4|nr:flagellar hook-length control protein FliK [Xenorhabdus nematophila]CCW30950.1 Flagellar hook-length control protein FliK [Xenorhabdus nematophila F1]
MNLTLLPTDLKLTAKNPEKNQPTLNDPINNSHSSQFGQLLNAETAAMQKPIVQAGKHDLKVGKPAADAIAESEWSQSQSVSDNAVEDKLQTGVTLQGNKAEFTLLKDDDLLSAHALSAVIPVQIAGLVNPPTNSVTLTENTDGLAENDLPEGENTLTHILPGKNAKDTELANADLDEDMPLSATQDATLNPKSEDAANIRPVLTPIAGQVKLATSNKAEYSLSFQNSALSRNTASSNNKEVNLFQTAIQSAPALTAATIETTPVDSPVALTTSPLLSAGQHVTGQQPAGHFQLNGTTLPILNAHLGSEEWQQQLNQHVLFFNRNGLQQAELRLHPQELGALHIRMSVEDNQAQLHFMSAHQNVRAALEAALPGLRHALADNGIQLAQSSINSDAQGNWQQEHHTHHHANDHSNSRANVQGHNLNPATGVTASHTSVIHLTPQQLASTRGGIDTFA